MNKKFILLGGGKILISILNDPQFQEKVSKDACAFFLTKEVISELPDSFNGKENIFEIFDKFSTEFAISECIERCNPGYLFSVQYPWILSKNIIDRMNFKILNLHNASLPNYRGHNSISFEILNDEKYHTSTLHWVGDVVDTGRVVFSEREEILPSDTAYSVWKKSLVTSKSIFFKWFSEIDNSKKFPLGTLINGKGKYYSKSLDHFKCAPENASLSDLDRYARAFYFPPHEPAYFELNGTKVYLLPKTWDYHDGGQG